MERAVTKIGMMAATAFMVSVGAFASTPSAATEPTTELSGRQAASEACLSFNQYGPGQVVQAAGDGLGDWIVWVRDKDNDLWLCNASSDGNVFANALVRGDLLNGRGGQAVALTPVTNARSIAAGAETAARLCAAAGRKVEATKVVATVEDGTGDYIVWLAASDQSYWLCNASADAKLYVFERVLSPLNTSPIDPANRSA
jgi:hypothetical protein